MLILLVDASGEAGRQEVQPGDFPYIPVSRAHSTAMPSASSFRAIRSSKSRPTAAVPAPHSDPRVDGVPVGPGSTVTGSVRSGT
jgi:hypothetical protein